ncbi:MAG TPA: MFS transporter, partial [bacterium]|nr:MFS transporter [bacterium]
MARSAAQLKFPAWTNPGWFLGQLTGRLSAPERKLVWMIGLYDFTYALSSVFVNVFLFRHGNDWRVVGLFNLSQFLFVIPAFTAGGYLARRLSYLRSYQLGFVFNAALYAAVLLLREDSIRHPWALGLLAGLGVGFYYLGQHALTFELVHSKRRDHFFSVSLVLSSAFRILAPALSGWIIHQVNGWAQAGRWMVNGYHLVFLATLLAYLALIYESTRVRVRPHQGRFRYWQTLTHPANPDWNRLMAGYFLWGVRNGVFWFATSLFIYRIFRDEWVVGAYGMGSNLLAVGASALLAKWVSPGNRDFGVMASCLLMGAASALLTWRMDLAALILFALLNSVGVSWFQVAFSAASLSVIDQAFEGKKRRLEYLTIRELPLGLGRVTGMAIFLGGQQLYGEAGLRWSFLILGLAQAAVWMTVPGKANQQKKPTQRRKDAK